MFFHETLEHEVHVERIDRTYPRLLKWSREYPDGMLMLGVRNHGRPFNRGDFYLSEDEAVKKYYRMLRDLPNRLGLHVHLASYPQINGLSYQQQYEAIKRGRDFLFRLGIETEDFAAGWWSYNYDTIKACVDLGLKRFHVLLWFLVKNPPHLVDGVTIVRVNHNNHDYMLAS